MSATYVLAMFDRTYTLFVMTPGLSRAVEDKNLRDRSRNQVIIERLISVRVVYSLHDGRFTFERLEREKDLQQLHNVGFVHLEKNVGSERIHDHSLLEARRIEVLPEPFGNEVELVLRFSHELTLETVIEGSIDVRAPQLDGGSKQKRGDVITH
jgi:hypothetical protein